jgi:hypothetical protein
VFSFCKLANYSDIMLPNTIEGDVFLRAPDKRAFRPKSRAGARRNRNCIGHVHCAASEQSHSRMESWSTSWVEQCHSLRFMARAHGARAHTVVASMRLSLNETFEMLRHVL